MSRFVVTGCAGFIGSHLVEALLSRGDDVVGIDSFTGYYERGTKEANLKAVVSDAGFSLSEADLVTCELDEMIAGSGGVFHLAAQPGVRQSWGEPFEHYVRNNVLVSQRVFEAASRLGRRVVWASSSSVYGNPTSFPTPEDARLQPISPYGVTKVACEYLARAYVESGGLEAVGLRYFTVYGPRQRPDMAFQQIIAALRGGTPFSLYGSGGQTRDVTYVGDAVAATLAAMQVGRRSAVYNVGGGNETSLREAIALIEELSGRRLAVDRKPAARGDAGRAAADTSRARAELGWAPATTLRAGLAAQLDSMDGGLSVTPQ